MWLSYPACIHHYSHLDSCQDSCCGGKAKEHKRTKKYIFHVVGKKLHIPSFTEHTILFKRDCRLSTSVGQDTSKPKNKKQKKRQWQWPIFMFCIKQHSWDRLLSQSCQDEEKPKVTNMKSNTNFGKKTQKVWGTWGWGYLYFSTCGWEHLTTGSLNYNLLLYTIYSCTGKLQLLHCQWIFAPFKKLVYEVISI